MVQRRGQQDGCECWNNDLSLRSETQENFPMRGQAREVYSMDHLRPVQEGSKSC